LVLRAADRVDVPWRNGAGMTSEIGVSPAAAADDFVWRLSVATVDSDTSFSTFSGVDRCLLALSPQGLNLVDEGQLVELTAFESYRFPGENSVASTSVTRSTLDLNLMTRRALCTGTLESCSVAGTLCVETASGGCVVIVILAGTFAVGSEKLAILDAVQFFPDSTDTYSLTGSGQIAIARVRALQTI
jgi:hypothetical protein